MNIIKIKLARLAGIINLAFIVSCLVCAPLFALETIICSRTVNGMSCSKYNGGGLDTYEYGPAWEYSEDKVGYTESEGMDSEIEKPDEDKDEIIYSYDPSIPFSKEWWK